MRDGGPEGGGHANSRITGSVAESALGPEGTPVAALIGAAMRQSEPQP
jgi:hypothetical protein